MSPAGIRPARPADAARIAAIADAAYRPYLARMNRTPAPMEEDYGARIAEGLTWVLEEDGEILGLLVLETHADHLLLDNIAVDPARHGRGVGRRLLDFTEDEARRRGYGVVQLYTNEVMVENIAMYRRLGYVETGRKQDRGYDRVFFRKAL
ncbi:GNAT family N-acetyltransferase [Pelagibius marinus]|uniref:GNAT family N-acetyltransferase n=1 Tax=Pelagibius marinus TaxID=2762760 RepID=UPI001872829A|nr:GNAT family N-acetyltransferase [Pelagibius marinus]